MVRVIQPSIPAEYEELWNKIMRHFERYGVPIWCRNWFQNTRRGDRQRAAATRIPTVADAWNALSEAQKTGWNDAANVIWNYKRGYRLFVADSIYREILKLSVPGASSLLHQLLCVKMSNAGGSDKVSMRRDDKDLVGQLTLKFSYKKDEKTPSGVYAFKVKTTAYYLGQGNILSDIDEFSAPAGNVAWNQISRTIGTVDRQYFHVEIVLSIDNYDAEIFIDNIFLDDKIGLAFQESFFTARYGEWEPTPLWRKRYWVFTPSYSTPFFEFVYPN